MIYALALPILLIGGLALTARPTAGLYLLAIVLVPNSLISQLLQGNPTATAFGAIKDVLCLTVLVGVLSKRGIRAVPPPLFLLTLGFLVIGLAGVLRTPSLYQGIYGWRNDFYPVLLLMGAPLALEDPEVRRKLSTLMVFLAEAASAVACYTWHLHEAWLYRTHIFPPTDGQFPYQFFTAGNHTPRAFSPYSSANDLAVASSLALALIACRGDWSVRRRVLLSLLPLTAVVLSRSRSGLLDLAVLAVVLFAYSFKRYAAAALSVASGALIVMGILYVTNPSTHFDASAINHGSSVATALATAVTHPLGLGVGTVGPRALLFSPDATLVESSWLLLALEAGLLALLLYCLILYWCVRVGLRAKMLSAFLAPATVAATLVSQLVLPTLQQGSVSYTMWLGVSLGVGAAIPAWRHAHARPASTADARQASSRLGKLSSPVAARRGPSNGQVPHSSDEASRDPFCA